MRGPYIVVHMRGWDKNTYYTSKGAANQKWFCTRKVVASLLDLGVPVLVISNNISWATSTLHHLAGISFINASSAFEDMALLLSSTAIVQHAVHGYSSYSNVPAMAKGIPLLSTYKGPYHRFKEWRDTGLGETAIPSEFHDCSTRGNFRQRVLHRIRVMIASRAGKRKKATKATMTI